MNFETGQLVKFSYMDDDDVIFGIITKTSKEEVKILWIFENATYTVSYRDFQHALDTGVCETFEEKG